MDLLISVFFWMVCGFFFFFFFQAEDGIRDGRVTGVQTCALPIFGEPDVAADLAMRRRGVGRGGQPLVERAAFVRLDMAAGRPAQLCERDQALQDRKSVV